MAELNGEAQPRVTQIILQFDHATATVQIGVEACPIGLLQMILSEATIQADQMRRRAAIAQIQNEQADAAVRAAIGNGKHGRM